MYYSKAYILRCILLDMKINKMFNVDIELAEKCKNLNASELVNRLLIKHFEQSVMASKYDSMSTEQLEKALVIEKKRESLNKELEELE